MYRFQNLSQEFLVLYPTVKSRGLTAAKNAKFQDFSFKFSQTSVLKGFVVNRKTLRYLKHILKISTKLTLVLNCIYIN
jgi:hypothetical protein